MSLTREIPREEWIRFFDDFSKPHEGWIITLEVLGSRIGAQEEASGMPLVGISADVKGRPCCIEVIVGGRPDRHVTHIIHTPKRVWLSEPSERSHEAVQIESEDGTSTVVSFRHVAAEQTERLLPERSSSAASDGDGIEYSNKKRRNTMANMIRRQDPTNVMPFGGNRDPFGLMRELLRWDPFHELGALPGVEFQAFVPTFDVKETKNALILQADLPGITEEDVNIQVSGNRLTISGERKAEERKEGENYFAFERSYGTFSRTFTLPDDVNADKVQAELNDGVLKVVLPKRPEAQPKRISLRSGKSASATSDGGKTQRGRGETARAEGRDQR